jgi:hypothetical protein
LSIVLSFIALRTVSLPVCKFRGTEMFLLIKACWKELVCHSYSDCD